MKNILNKNGIICVLDIGTYTTKCLLARRITNDKIELLGHGLCKTEGLKASKICNAEQVINTIKKTVEEAEKQANEKIENIIVSVCSNEIESTLQNEDKILTNSIITKQDIYKLQNKIEAQIQDGKNVSLHTFFISYVIDDKTPCNIAPINLSGEKLSMYYNNIHAPKNAVQDLKTCVEMSHLNVSKFVASPLMVGLASLKKEELEYGTLVIDFGAGSTGVSYFIDNQNIFCDTISFGSFDITKKIEKELQITPQKADDIKIKYGSCLNNQSYKDIEIKTYPIGIKDNTSLITKTKYDISQIIIPEIDNLLEKINEVIAKRNISDGILEIVLVGDGCQLEGFKERLIQKLDNQNCRFGEPVHIPCGQKIIDSKIKNSFMNCFGMLYYVTHELLKNEDCQEENSKSRGKLQKIWNFFSNI